MAIRIPYGIDPEEVWELDFCAEVARMKARVERDVARSYREALAQEKSDGARQDLEASAARSEARAVEADADLAGYVAGSGPIFRVGAIPGRRRAELLGRRQELNALPTGAEKAIGLSDWARDVVAASVRGHRNLRRASGGEVPFDAVDGRPSERTLEAYDPILADLAWVVVSQQRLGADGKNG